jgi:uncharacterized protein
LNPTEISAVNVIDPLRIIADYYRPGSAAYDMLVRHGEQVAAKALTVAAHLASEEIDETFLHEAALLHDIGIFMTDTPSLGCHGDHPYICHGTLGRELLEGRGLDRHALVCERHVGVGLSAGDIQRQNLPLPVRDMRPLAIEEEIICYADKFYSKSSRQNQAARTTAEIVAMLRRYGEPPVQKFQAWVRRFENGVRRPSPSDHTG